MKQPDRAERVVAKYGERSMDEYHTCVLTDREVIGLLRKEHAWMRRMVKRMDDVHFSNMSEDYQAGMHHAYCNVMAQLNQRRK